MDIPATFQLLWVVLLWTYVQMSVWTYAVLSQRMYLGVDLLGHRVALCWTGRGSIGVSRSSCTVSHSHQQCTRAPISLCLRQPLLLSVFLMMIMGGGGRGVSLWVWFAFTQWLVMLSIFARAYGPRVYLLWRYVCSDPLPIFELSCLSVVDF